VGRCQHSENGVKATCIFPLLANVIIAALGIFLGSYVRRRPMIDLPGMGRIVGLELPILAIFLIVFGAIMIIKAIFGTEKSDDIFGAS